MKIRSLCVFCGSSPGLDSIYGDKTKELGEYLASNSIALVYGGGAAGLMGLLAESVMTNGGHVTELFQN